MKLALLRTRSKLDGGVTGEASPPPLDPAELGAYFALIEVRSLLRLTVEQQLRDAIDLGYVQFQLLTRLGTAAGA